MGETTYRRSKMKGFINGLKWTTAAVLLVTMMAAPAFAAKTTPVKKGNTAVPVVPRAIPNLIPYHKFDPPNSKLFDISKLNISGDLRVRPEMRNSIRFGLGTTALGDSKSSGIKTTAYANDFFVQQWVRLGLRYDISSDVSFFFQPQYSKNWGAEGGNPGANKGGELASGNDIFARQAFMLIKNFGLQGLTVKAGRQLVVWGNHRMMGHFDWNNTGWSHDGITANYKVAGGGPLKTIQAGWLRSDEGDCDVSGGGCSTATNSGTVGDANLMYVRMPMKVGGIAFEPVWLWHDGGTTSGGAIEAARPDNQSRHTVGARAATKRTISKIKIDTTIEGYYQFGEIGNTATTRDMDIEAYAIHADVGFTLPVPMQPRLGLEWNQASGDSHANSCSGTANASQTACNQTWRGFDQLFPTNHIHFGYMDRMSWKNMVHFGATLNIRPSANSHFEVAAHKFYLNNTNDNWYAANQNIYMETPVGNQEDDLGYEIDVVYTHFLTPGNHVAFQVGGGVLVAGTYVNSNPWSQNSLNGAGVGDETWGYTQLWINW